MVFVLLKVPVPQFAVDYETQFQQRPVSPFTLLHPCLIQRIWLYIPVRA